MEIIKTVRDGFNEVTNHIKIDGGSYIHKQIEKIDGKVYMRIKSRKLYEITSI